MKGKMTATLPAFALALALLALPLGLAGCAEKVALTGLEVAGEVPVLAVGQSAPVALSYAFTKEAPTEDEIAAALEQVVLVWASGDAAVATVDEAGVVTAVALGSTEVTVSDSEGLYTAAVPVTVVQPLDGATVHEAVTLDLLAGETAVLVVEAQPADASGVTVAFASSDAGVVMVAADGTLTPVAEGEAVVTTAVTGDGLDGPMELSLTTAVTVALVPQGIALEQTEGLLYVGYSHPLAPYTLPEEAPETTYSFASSDEAVATVDAEGRMTAVGAGTCTITVTSAEGHTAAYVLTVVAAPAGGGTAGGRSGTGRAGGSAGTAGSAGGNGNTGAAGSGGNTGGGFNPHPNGDGSPENPYRGDVVPIPPDDGRAIDGLG